MNEYGLTVKNILESLPCVLANDEHMAALAEGIARVLAIQDEEIRKISIYPHLDDAPEDLCDILAGDFDVQWYSYNQTPEVKRNQIRSTFRIHKRLGTAAAVKELVQSVFGHGEVLEWFDYGGRPYHFCIQTDAALYEDTYEYIYNLIRLVKSVRSRLDAVQILRHTELAVHAGIGQYMVYQPPAVMDGYRIARDTTAEVHAGISPDMIYRPAAILEMEGGRAYATAYE